MKQNSSIAQAIAAQLRLRNSTEQYFRLRLGRERRRGGAREMGVAGRRENVSFWVLDGFIKTSASSLERNGGDDETRTRDLCRDSNTYLQQLKRLPETAKNLKIRSSRKHLGLAFGLEPAPSRLSTAECWPNCLFEISKKKLRYGSSGVRRGMVEV
jgi:hypothetical protein